MYIYLQITLSIAVMIIIFLFLAQRLGCALLLLPSAFKQPCSRWFSLNNKVNNIAVRILEISHQIA